MKLLAVSEGSQAPYATSISNTAPTVSSTPGILPSKEFVNSEQTASKNSSNSKSNCLNRFNSIIRGDMSSNGFDTKSCKSNSSTMHTTANTTMTNMKNDTNNSNHSASNGYHHHEHHKINRVRTDSSCIEEDPQLELDVTIHQEHLLSSINNLRRQGHFCDITLVVEEHEYPVHKAVIAACSPYLFDFLCCLEDTVEQQPSYKLKDLSHVGFEHLLNFMYTGRICVPLDDVAVTYTTALVLKMDSAIRECARFLTQHLTTSNCLGIRRLIKDQEVKVAVDEYIRENLSGIMSSKSFFGLNDLQAEVVGLDEDITNETMERRLFSLVMDWAKNNLNDLKPKLDRLTEQVNVLYLDSDNTLRDCVDMEETTLSSDDDMVQDYKILHRRRIKNVVKQVNQRTVKPVNQSPIGPQPFHKFNLNPEEALSVAEREWSIVATCKTHGNNFYAIVVLDGHLMGVSVHLRPSGSSQADSNGSSSGSGPNSPSISPAASMAKGPQQSSMIRKASIIPLESMSNPRCALGAVCVAGKLIVCGGYDRGECLSSVEEFSIMENKWKQLPEMSSSRGRFSAGDLDGYIYVCGGSDGWKELSCVERYDPSTQEWTFMASMRKERSSHGVATLNGKLYCIGGCEGQRSIADCEVYDPSSNKWSKIASLNTARSQTCVCVMDDLLFAVGGTDMWNTLNTVEVYNPESNEWTLHSQLNIGRRGAGVEIVNGLMIVVGGSDGIQSLVSTEIYDKGSEMWTVGPPLTVQRANLSCVTIDDRLFAIGGFSGKKFLNTLEWLDVSDMEWFCYAPRHDLDNAVESNGQIHVPVVSKRTTSGGDKKNCFDFKVAKKVPAKDNKSMEDGNVVDGIANGQNVESQEKEEKLEALQSS